MAGSPGDEEGEPALTTPIPDTGERSLAEMTEFMRLHGDLVRECLRLVAPQEEKTETSCSSLAGF